MSKNHLTFNNVGSLVVSGIESKSARVILGAAVSAFAGLLASRAEIFGSCAPFGVAAVAAATGPDSLFVLLGAAVGYFLPYGIEYPAKYVAAAVVVLVFKWLISGFKELSAHPATKPFIASGALLVTGMSIVMNTGMFTYDVIICLAETLLCGCSVVFLQNAMPYLKKPAKIWGLNQQQLISVTISCCIVMLALSGLQAGGLSLGRILGVLAVLIAARYGGAAGGAVTGVSIGMIMSLGDQGMSLITACYGFGGLIAGVFGPFGKFGCTVAFVLANAVAGVYINSDMVVTELYEVMIASVAFMIIPENFSCRMSVLFVPVRSGGDSAIKNKISERLLNASAALQDISGTVTEVTDRLKKITNDDISAVFASASEEACKKCGMRMYCWETAYNDTMNVMNDVTPALRKNGRLERGDFPAHFIARCCKLGNLMNAINRCHAEYNTKKCSEFKTAQLRNVLTEQLSGISGLLKNMASECSSFSGLEFGLSNRIRAVFASCGLNVGEPFCHIDSGGRITVEAEIPPEGRNIANSGRLGAQLSEACGANLDNPVFIENDGALRVKFLQKPDYSVRFGHAYCRKDGESICGDTCETFTDPRGRAIMIVSDGMGCGGRAAIDSNLASRFMAELTRTGFEFDDALSIINSSIMLKSADESFATLDIACIDLYTGQAEFLKAGAPPTYLRRCGRVERISQSSMPVGIIKGVKFEKRSACLHSGDLVMLMSDGAVTGDNDGWLIEMLEAYRGENLKSFTQELVQAAKEHRDDGHDDDITVIAAYIR